MTMTDSDAPVSITEIKLEACSGHITRVDLYNHRAEVTRSFRLDLAHGQNDILVLGLSNDLDDESLRVEGKGSATIHDVTIARSAPTEESQNPPSDKVIELRARHEELNRMLARYRRCTTGLESYMQSLTAQHIPPENLGSSMSSYVAASQEYDEKIAATLSDIRVVEQALKEEVRSTEKASPELRRSNNSRCAKMATLSVSTEHPGEVEMILTYMVLTASWTPFYEVRATPDNKDAPVDIIYKAKIEQRTGEDWVNVPMTLQTAAPTYGVGLPKLKPWTLSVRAPPEPYNEVRDRERDRQRDYERDYGRPRPRYRMANDRAYSPTSPTYSPASPTFSPAAGVCVDTYIPAPTFKPTSVSVSENAGVNASFNVPGLVNISSDGVGHSVTLATLTPEAKLIWFSAPKADVQVHLTAAVKNTSEYTLLPGASSVYLDGVFISKSTIPLVSPQQSFVCALGLDPSIRITYHALVKKGSQTGILSKTNSTSFLRRITVHNTKPRAIQDLKVIDQVPVSQDSQIIVKLVSPALPLPSATSSAAPTAINVAPGIVAQWYNDEREVDEKTASRIAGKDGQLAWICSLPAQKKVEVSLSWDVTASSQTVVDNLEGPQ